ncbi:MAG: hypothetical protein HYR91_03735 [Flavobacteriia bacterium]|nr:hypothetical protein [Flavobacteriia bacterium]
MKLAKINIILVIGIVINSCSVKNTKHCKSNQQNIFEFGDFVKTVEFENFITNSVFQGDTSLLIAKNANYTLIYEDRVKKKTFNLLKNNKLSLKINDSKLNWFFYDESKFTIANRLIEKKKIAIFIADYDSDKKNDLIIRDRVHNGTFNAIMDRVFSIDQNEANYKYAVSYIINRIDDVVLFDFICDQHLVYSKMRKKGSNWNFEGELKYKLNNNNLQISGDNDSLIYYYPPVMEN